MKTQIETARTPDGRLMYSYWKDADTLIMVQPFRIRSRNLRGLSYTVEGTKVISVAAYLSKAERAELIKEFLGEKPTTKIYKWSEVVRNA